MRTHVQRSASAGKAIASEAPRSAQLQTHDSADSSGDLDESFYRSLVERATCPIRRHEAPDYGYGALVEPPTIQQSLTLADVVPQRGATPQGPLDGGIGYRRKQPGSAYPVQRFAIGQLDDPAEQQADAMAESVTREVTAPRVGSSSHDATPQQGDPLDAALRTHYESRFGVDFSSVRVHRGAQAAASARRIGAQAYTAGEHVVFDEGAWAPEVQNGRHLIAHELAHVVQQRQTSDTVVRRECDPANQSCPSSSAPSASSGDTAPTCAASTAPTNISPLTSDAGPATLPLLLDVSGPGANGETRVEQVQLDNPILSRTSVDLYLVPDEVLFATQAEAREGTCHVPCTPGDPNCALPPQVPSIQPEPTPSTPGPTPAATAVAPTAPVQPAAPRPARFAPGQVVYALDGPIRIVSATGGLVTTLDYTKYAVGAGSTALVRTKAGLVIIDAGMQQQGGNYNAVLADAIVDKLVQDIAGEPVVRMVISHMHADHTVLAPRIYARIPFAVLELNALQALMSGSGGMNKGQELAQEMIAERRRYVEQQVRRELTSNPGTANPQTLDAAIANETARRLAAMPVTQVELQVPAGGQVTPVRVPIGNIALPSGVGPTAAPITQPSVGPGAATVLNPNAGATTQQALASGSTPSNEAVDANSTSGLFVMPNGAQLLVISDVRAPDAVALEAQFTQAMARLGKPVQFLIIDALHHLQRGFTTGDAVARASQLGAFTRMLYNLSRAQQEGTFVGGAVVVSALASPGGSGRNYVDPSLVWVLRSAGFEVMPATGGGETVGAGQNVAALTTQLPEGPTVSGFAGGPYPTLVPEEKLVTWADAALAQIDDELRLLNQNLQTSTTDSDRAHARQQIAEQTAERTRINAAKLAYIQAVQREIGRGPNDTTRPAVAPAPAAAAPAQAEAATLRALLASYTAPAAGQLRRFTPEELVVLGQEQLTQLTPAAQGLLEARKRLAEAAAVRLLWSSTPEQRAPVLAALQVYRTRLASAVTSAPPPNRAVLQSALSTVERELTTLTGLFSPQLDEVNRAAALADQASRNAARPAKVASTLELTDSVTADRIIKQNNGYAFADGQLYRLTVSGQAITYNPVRLGPAFVPRTAAAPAPALPPGGAAGALPPARSSGAAQGQGEQPIVVPGVPAGFTQVPNVINISGRTIILSDSGETIPPTPPGAANMRPGELIVRGFSGGWFVCDPETRLPIAVALVGGEAWQVQKDGRLILMVDAAGGVQEAGAPARMATPGEQIPYGTRVPTPEAPGGPSTGTRVVAGGLGILIVAQQILEPIGKTLQAQRANIALSQAQLAFWMRFGAKPSSEMRTQNGGETQPVGTAASTGIFSDPVYPTVTAIDVNSLANNLKASIQTYQDFVLWLDMGVQVGAIGMNPGLLEPTAKRGRRSYWANVAGPLSTRPMPIDLTPVLEPIEKSMLDALEDATRTRVSSLPTSERAQVFALKSGSETRLYRTQGSGWIHPREVIHSANFMLGPHPWVHVLDRRDGWAFVDAANADAARAAMVSMYTIEKPIDEVLVEAQKGGRPIKGQSTDSIGTLQGFVAGPSPTDPRFGGDTRYYRRPDQPNIWTVAIGQLDRFWVRESDLQSIENGEVDRYAAQPAAKEKD